jgi:tetratricopeptide (TPR) repeat protein
MSEVPIEDQNAGETFLAAAEQIAQVLRDIDEHSHALAKIAGAYARMGLLEIAVEVAEAVDDPFTQDQVFADIALKVLEFGDVEYADEILGMIQDESLQALAMEQVSLKYAEAGEPEKALGIARGLADDSPALSGIASLYAEKGDWERAVELAQSIEDPELKATALSQLAAKAIRDKRTAGATELLRQATRAVESIEFSEGRINTLLGVASLYKEAEEYETASQLVSRAFRQCDEFEGARYQGLPETYSRDEALAKIASSFAELHNYEQADQAIEQIEHPAQAAVAVANLAVEHHKESRTDQAQALLKEALEITEDVQINSDRELREQDFALSKIAASFATTGNYQEALRTAARIASDAHRNETIITIAKLAVRAGNDKSVSEAENAIDDPYQKTRYRLDLSDIHLEHGQPELAESVLDQTLSETKSISNHYYRAEALITIAHKLRQGEQPNKLAEVSEILFQALDTIASIENKYQQTFAMVDLANEYHEAGLVAGEKEQAVVERILLRLE